MGSEAVEYNVPDLVEDEVLVRIGGGFFGADEEEIGLCEGLFQV
jgi:hypothetical protein